MTGVFLPKLNFQEVKMKFQKLKNVSEFVSLLNYIDREIHRPDKEFFLLTFTHLYALSKTKNSRYSTFSISKKNGKLRTLNAPDKQLLRVQKLINILLQIVFEDYSHYCSNGFLIGKDIKRNALLHIGKRFVLNMDIKDFFPSVNFRRVKTVLELAPFNLTQEREKIGFLIANLVSFNDLLPQGAPTSPLMSNIVTQKLDRKISKFCNQKKIKYSRYADDLSFSSNKDTLDSNFIDSIIQILNEENFIVNGDKTRLRDYTQSQLVTGLVVNKKVNVKREYLQTIRAMLNNWEKGGLRFAEQEFKKHQPENKKHHKFKSVLLGHLSFLKLVRGEDDFMVKKLRLKYVFLNNLLDYGYIDHPRVLQKLSEDNVKMEKVFFEKDSNENAFISFCTIAFHQVENLINYYYWKKYPDLKDLLEALLSSNERFRKQYKDIKSAQRKIKKQKDLSISLLIYLYEKEFFFDENIYYDKHLILLREIRNDESHRCSVLEEGADKIGVNYLALQTKISQMGKGYVLNGSEKKAELNYKVLQFVMKENFKHVREMLKELSDNIKT